MNPVRRQRLLIAAMVLVAAAVAAVLLTLALQENMTYLHTPSEAQAGQIPEGSVFRLGGVVKQGSVRREAGSLRVDFAITDLFEDYPVRYEGILPDLFREGQSVIAKGRIVDGIFVADEVLAKHDETYMPPEVAEKMAESHARAAQLRAGHADAPAAPAEPEPPSGAPQP